MRSGSGMALVMASAVHVQRAAPLAVTQVVLQPRGVRAAIGLGLLQPGLAGGPEVITAAPAVTALMLQLLGAEAIGAPLSSRRIDQRQGGAHCSSGSGEDN